MNTYRIVTANGQTLTVSAEDSDLAIAGAEDIAAQEGVVAGPASLLLVTDQGEQKVGEFQFNGFYLPQSWAECKERLQAIRTQALDQARANTPFPCHQSRGVLLTATDDQGGSLTTADEYTFPTTLREFRQAIANLQQEHPSLTEVWAECGMNSALSVLDLHERRDYEPWTGEAATLIWRQGNKGIA